MVPAARAIPSLVLYQADTAQTGVARMKVDQAPFDDVRVRQAIQACIDHGRLLTLAWHTHVVREAVGEGNRSAVGAAGGATERKLVAVEEKLVLQRHKRRRARGGR